MERRIVEKLCGGLPIKKIGVNGTNVPVEALAKFAYPQIRLMLNRYFPIIVIFDREGRSDSVESISARMMGCLGDMGIDTGQVRVYVADCCSESWIMPCVDEKCEIIGELERIVPTERPGTKGMLKRRFRSKGRSYVETVDGVQLFCEIGARRMARGSVNFRKIAEELDGFCPWMKI